jgi:type I restriction enzyme S subunit
MKPSIFEQEKIVHGLTPVEAKIETEQSVLAKYQQLKTGLMQDLLTGKVEVSVAEETLKN